MPKNIKTFFERLHLFQEQVSVVRNLTRYASPGHSFLSPRSPLPLDHDASLPVAVQPRPDAFRYHSFIQGLAVWHNNLHFKDNPMHIPNPISIYKDSNS